MRAPPTDIEFRRYGPADWRWLRDWLRTTGLRVPGDAGPGREGARGAGQALDVLPGPCAGSVVLPSEAEREPAWSRRLVEDARILALVACRDSAPCGFLRLDIGPDRQAEVTVVVDPAQRRTGVARTLLRRARAESIDRRVRRLFALVEPSNLPAIDLFAGEGYEFTDVRVPGFAHLERWIHGAELQPPLEILP